tara:strand:- start:9231 stop:9599 length:369 start_codon:yes stop_codon:yes gene_type:complete
MTIKIQRRECGSKKAGSWTMEELKKALKKRKLSVSGTKLELCNRLKESTTKKRIQASVKPPRPTPVVKEKLLVSKKNYDPYYPHKLFYVSLYKQKPNSKLAADWIKHHKHFTGRNLSLYNLR